MKEIVLLVHAWMSVKEGKRDTFLKLAKFKETFLEGAVANIAQTCQNEK